MEKYICMNCIDKELSTKNIFNVIFKECSFCNKRGLVVSYKVIKDLKDRYAKSTTDKM